MVAGERSVSTLSRIRTGDLLRERSGQAWVDAGVMQVDALFAGGSDSLWWSPSRVGRLRRLPSGFHVRLDYGPPSPASIARSTPWRTCSALAIASPASSAVIADP
jgi:hypothetical protein